jgi:PAS domain S-box-containing protein
VKTEQSVSNDVLGDAARAIIDSSPNAIVVKDLNGVIIGWNPAAETIYGYTAAEIIGKPIAVLGEPGKFFESMVLINRILHGHAIPIYQTVRRRKDGRDVRVQISISPLRDGRGAIVGAVSVDRDVTQSSIGHEPPVAAFDLYSSSAIIQKDLAGNITHWSAGAERLYGFDASEVTGKPISMLMHPRNKDEMIEIIERIRLGLPVSDYVTERVRKDGAVVKVRISVSPRFDADQRLVGVISVASPSLDNSTPPRSS